MAPENGTTMASRRTAMQLYTRPALCLSLEASATRRNEVKARFVAERIQNDPVALETQKVNKESKASGGRKPVNFACEDVESAEDKGQFKVKSSNI